jgi:hypothetical protein
VAGRGHVDAGPNGEEGKAGSRTSADDNGTSEGKGRSPGYSVGERVNALPGYTSLQFSDSNRQYHG